MDEKEMSEQFELCKAVNEDEAKLKSGWFVNFKYDGERIMAVVKNGSVVMFNRRGKICNKHFREVEAELKTLPDCWLDGEIISMNDDFNKLQQRALTTSITKLKKLETEIPVKYMVFDILSCKDRTDLFANELIQRVEELKILFKKTKFKFVEMAKYDMDVNSMLKEARALNKEGIILKHRYGYYQKGKRSGDWVKCKFWEETTLTLIKYTINPAGIRGEDKDGNAVQIAGSQHIEVKELIDKKGLAEVEVQYLEKTAEGRLRFPSFRGVKK